MVTTHVSENIFNLDSIYQEGGFNYSVPRKFLESWLGGIGFGREVAYSPDELNLLEKDANAIYQRIMEKNPVHKKEVIITCGAPGAGKTVLLEQILKQVEEKSGEKLGYVDPDAVCLKQMSHTFGDQIEKAKDLPIDEQATQRRKAYADWRPASNAIHHIALAHLVKDGIQFCFGTTATGDKTYLGFKGLKEAGYQIKLIHVTAPDQVRVDSLKERDKVFIQTTDEDIIEKAKLLPQRIQDTYLKYGDVIEFYYRDGVKKDAVLSAIWQRQEGSAKGSLEIKNNTLYEKIKGWHDDNLYGRDDLLWEGTVEASSTKV